MSVSFPKHRFTLVLCLLLPLASSLAAADSPELVQELKALTSKAKQQNAADRWLQRALESLVAKYDNPWTRVLLEEDFSDGDYQSNPAWHVLSGRFRVDASLGLVSRVQGLPAANHPAANASPNTAAPATNNNDVAGALLGALLQNALGGGSPRQSANSTPSSAPSSAPSSTPSASRDKRVETAQIRLPLAISNAFALQSEFSLHSGTTASYDMEYNLFQGTSARWGYRLRLRIDEPASIELQRVRRGRNEIIASAALPAAMKNGAIHSLNWHQTPAGLVQVALDDRPLFEIQDKAFRDGYQSISFVNRGGDIALRRLDIKGTE